MDNSLAFFIPHHGRPKISLRVPESHSLHVCPLACGRRRGLRALKNGEADGQSFLYISRTDIASGDYEGLMVNAVGELLEVLSPAPRAFMIYLSCVDDFLGTDEKALLDCLEEHFPGQSFTICHIDPVAADGPVAPGARMQAGLYSLLRREEKRENSVNLIGSFVMPSGDGELFDLLGRWGIDSVRHLPQLKSYDEFQRMAAARLNIVMMAMGRYAAEKMEDSLGIPWLDMPVSYCLDEIDAGYETLAAALGGEQGIWGDFRQKAEEAVGRCLSVVGDTPVIVDSSAAMRPFALAKALAEYGFNVSAVFITHGKDDDLPQRRWLEEMRPQTKIIRAGRYDSRKSWGISPESLAIGYDAAYSMRLKHFADVQRDEGLFGFHGLMSLMELIIHASETEARWD